MQTSAISQTTFPNTIFHLNKSTGTKAASSYQKVVETNSDSETNKSNTVSERDFPLESYAFPSWYSNYLSDEMIYTPKINYEYIDIFNELTKDNYLSDEERNLLRNYLQNDPIQQERLAKEAYRYKFKDELYEYGTLRHKYFSEALRENGVENGSHADYYEKVILDKVSSEKIHQSMQKRVESSPRFLGLMEILGIQSNT